MPERSRPPRRWPRSGSTTRKYATAFTRTGTLSRVMTSCGGTTSVIVRSSTCTMRSMIGMSRKRPGPFGCAEQPAEPEHHPALVLAQHPHGAREEGDREGGEHRQDDDRGERDEHDHVVTPSVECECAGATRRVSPSTCLDHHLAAGVAMSPRSPRPPTARRAGTPGRAAAAACGRRRCGRPCPSRPAPMADRPVPRLDHLGGDDREQRARHDAHADHEQRAHALTRRAEQHEPARRDRDHAGDAHEAVGSTPRPRGRGARRRTASARRPPG